MRVKYPVLLDWGPRLAFLLLDVVVIYLAFVAALKIAGGEWLLRPTRTGIGGTIGITVCAYLLTLGIAGLYRTRPESLHLQQALRFAAALAVGWMMAVAATYFLSPTLVPARSIMGAQLAFSLVGILGSRSLYRYVAESRRPRIAPTPDDVVKSINFDSILRRNPTEIDTAGLRNHLAGRTVLVTGAGGSIGAKLSERLIALNPFRIILVDISEYNLFQLENVLRAGRFEGELEFRIADVRDSSIMRTIFSTFHPNIVFHAAAYKHVPLMERHPVEAFTNNTLSTVSLIHLCEAFDAEQFVFVSTDKAVEPSSVLGATKRLAEWYVRAVHGEMRCKTVRFGNVLGSHGSVVPYFAEQIRRGGPVTITDPEMRRFIMTDEEACSLILQTVLLDDAPVYTLRMGAPVRIADVARHMIRRLADSHVEIVYTGIRPGEKLEESLWSNDETPLSTTHADIVGIHSQAPFSRTELDAWFRYLEQLCADNRTAELRKALFQKKLAAVPAQAYLDYPDNLRN
jgi:FlaA1/EpsC-like NDP-sugar epimerase